MADRTVRAIFQAVTSPAQKGMRDLAKDVDTAGKKVDGLTKDLKGLDAQKVNPKIDLAIEAAERQIKDITAKLGDLRTMEVTPEVTADIRQAERQLADARKALRQLNAAKAEMRVTADTRPARKAVDDLADEVGDAGIDGGEEAGENIASGILDALQTIPIAGAVIGVGAAIAGGLLLGIKQGLAIEAERDLFSAQTGLDEDTANRFGRAAGEAYAQAWGDSVADNLDVARRALAAGIIDTDATDAEIENVIAKFQAMSDLFEFDIAMAVQGVGNLMKTGLVKDADQAFDLIVAASQKLPSDDLLETLNEYSNQFVTLGISGEQAFGLIVQGAEAGARDTDKVADSLKELGLRIREGLDPARDALSSLGLDVEDTIAAFTEGGPRAQDAIDRVFDALRVMKEEGGNTQEVIAALFGGPGEDLGAALFALDIENVADAIGGVEGAAGAADRALQTMTDNAATEIETARRSIEIAMDGIKGALAAAFSDDITAAAEWVQANRAPLMEFFLDVINGAFEMGVAFVDFAATALEAVASVADSAASVLQFLPGFSIADKKSVNEEADNIRGLAESMRSDLIGALEDSQAAANDWAMPEIMKARVADATRAMTEELDAFIALVNSTEDGTITINGDVLPAEEAFAALVESIDGETGTVTIDGNPIPAEDVVDYLIATIGESGGEVTVGADDKPARDDVRGLLAYTDRQSASVTVNADTARAEREISYLARGRTVTVRVATVGGTTGGLLAGSHSGGFLPGRYTGGWVPGSDPGYDNILWPLNSGGRTLAQPLAGGEYVVNSRSAEMWGPVLEAINAGMRPQSITETNNSPVTIQTLYANDYTSFMRQAARATRYENTKKGPGA